MEVIAYIITQDNTLKTSDFELAVKHFRALMFAGKKPRMQVIAPEKKIWGTPEKGESTL